MRSKATALIALLAFLMVPVAATDDAWAKPKWEKAAAKDGVMVYNRPVEGSDLREIKAVGLIMHPIDRVWEVIAEMENYVEFMPYMDRLDILERGESHVVAYHQLDAPLVDPRDYTLKVWWKVDKEKGVYKRYWKVAKGKGPKVNPKFVRVTLADGSWTLQAKGPNKVRATYHLHTDPGGDIPMWLANKANSVSIPDIFKAVRKRSKNPKWRR